jgi:hypothetical protein
VKITKLDKQLEIRWVREKQSLMVFAIGEEVGIDEGREIGSKFGTDVHR